MNKQLLKRRIFLFWGMQLVISLVFSALFTIAADTQAGLSAFLGSMVCIIPNIAFATKLFKYQGARSAKLIVNSFYKGEAIKIILSGILFTIVFVSVKIHPLAFFTTYILMLITHWFAPLIIANKRHRPQSD